MATEEQTSQNAEKVFSNGLLRIGQKLTISNRIVSKLSFLLRKYSGSPTGLIYFQILKSSDKELIASKSWGDASTLTGTLAWCEATLDTAVTINEEVIILVYYPTMSTVAVGIQNTDVKASENYIQQNYPAYTWTDITDNDLAYIYTYGILPTLTTQATTKVAKATATGNGNISNLGIPSATQHGHCWSLSANPTIADSKTENGAGSVGAFTSAITGLTAGTLYHTRAYATNSYGTSYGEDVTFAFFTPMFGGGIAIKRTAHHYIDAYGQERYTVGTPIPQPTVFTQETTDIAPTTATGNSYITFIGDAAVTQHGHCWSLSAYPTTADSKTENGAGAVGAFTSAITGLTTETLYHTRAYATNAYGTSYGDDVEFTTT